MIEIDLFLQWLPIASRTKSHFLDWAGDPPWSCPSLLCIDADLLFALKSSLSPAHLV